MVSDNGKQLQNADMEKKLESRKGRWLNELPNVLWTYRTSERRPARNSHYSLVYSAEAILPTKTTLPTLRSKFAQLTENNASLALDKVWVMELFLRVSIDVKKKVNAGKTAEKWEGPYQIRKVLGIGAYKLQTLDGKKVVTTWNVIHLKKFYA
ncbi:hypothetical protein WN944_000988 [Citrus x changshan-huyou]|uniref:Uncharacterized protein n=1 Tax=Citrus x changshan-huyou TaxID=2935761 RepID=A0AAP0QMC5_9ROSI